MLNPTLPTLDDPSRQAAAESLRTLHDEPELLSPLFWLHALLALSLTMVGGVMAVVTLPTWLPLVRQLHLGEPAVLSRLGAALAYGVLWCATAVGLLLARRPALRARKVLFRLHRHLTLLGLALVLLHVVMLVLDPRRDDTLLSVLAPLALSDVRPAWVGLLGKLSLYLLLAVTLSFFLRSWLGTRVWRAVHLAGYLTFALALAHGLFAGSEGSALWLRGAYAVSGGILLALVVWRAARSLGEGRRG